VFAHLVVAAVFKTVGRHVKRIASGFDSHTLPPKEVITWGCITKGARGKAESFSSPRGKNMKLNIQTIVGWGIAAMFFGCCFGTGGYVAHDIFRTVDDQNVVWLINRAAAAAVITLFIALGFIVARAIEYVFVRWWKAKNNSPPED